MEVEKITLVVISGIGSKENGDGKLMVLDLWMVTAERSLYFKNWQFQEFITLWNLQFYEIRIFLN